MWNLCDPEKFFPETQHPATKLSVALSWILQLYALPLPGMEAGEELCVTLAPGLWFACFLG